MKTLHRVANNRVTFHVAKAELAAAGMTLTRIGADYRVGYRDGNGEPFYSCDLIDAFENGRCMAQRRNHRAGYLLA